MNKKLTHRQLELLRYIESVIQSEQRVPSYREMAKALNLSAVGSIQDLVKTLIEKEFLEKGEKGLRLAGARQSPVMTIPIVGEVAAGAMQDAFEVAMGSLPLSPDLLPARSTSEDFFALRVSGESMIDAGILPRDILVIYKKARVRSGDIVVASHRGEATVKEYRAPKKSGDAVELIPHNKKLKPILVPANEEFQILGKVISVQRYLA